VKLLLEKYQLFAYSHSRGISNHKPQKHQLSPALDDLHIKALRTHCITYTEPEDVDVEFTDFELSMVNGSSSAFTMAAALQSNQIPQLNVIDVISNKHDSYHINGH